MSKRTGIPAKCPKCGSTQIRPMVYGQGVPADWINGLPVNAIGFVLGGCCAAENAPTWICLDCQYPEK